MPKPWNDITAFYRDLVERGMQIHGMLQLVEQIEASRYAAGISAVASSRE